MAQPPQGAEVDRGAHAADGRARGIRRLVPAGAGSPGANGASHPPVRQAMWDWLTSPLLRHPSGHCLAWAGSDTGYPYPEITGLLLSLLATRAGEAPAGDDSLVGELAAALFAHPQSSAGVGRASIGYTFDTAMAVRGLLAHREALGPVQLQATLGWCELLLAQLAAGAALAPGSRTAGPPRWSTSFGAHQSKVAGALLAFREVCPQQQGTIDAALGRLGRLTVLAQGPDGRFRASTTSPSTYLHAHCYALEGLLMQHLGGTGDYRAELERGVGWLASVQEPSGAVRAWHDGARFLGPIRMDATAQAVRLFRLTDPTGYRDHIEAGTAFLVGHQDQRGGVPYEPGSADINTWATIFAVQALDDDLLAGGEMWARLV